ncbi:MAG TPA: hypothetical protein VFS43_14945 [Polyangiaceae bacterium]|nr:hypothetical protein [Polyangiaceae bacterium]
MFYIPPSIPTKEELARLSKDQARLAFDTLGSVAVERHEFRFFETADGSWPVAFRGDTRQPEAIFVDGFFPRESALEKYARHKPDGGDPTKDFGPAAVIRLGNLDMDTRFSVSLSLDFAVTTLFPFDPKKLPFPERRTRIYVCAVRSWLELYRMQELLAPHLAYAREVTSLGVPPEHVLGALEVNVRCVGATKTEFTVHRVTPNAGTALPKAWNLFMLSTYKAMSEDPALRSAPFPSAQKPLSVGLDGKVVAKLVTTVVDGLRGDRIANRVQEGRAPALDLRDVEREVKERLKQHSATQRKALNQLY